MAEFIRTEEKVVNVGEPVVFENNTDSDFSVSAAVVFRKSGVYEVSIVGRRTIISKLPERKKGRWVDNTYCSECGWVHETDPGFIGSVDGFNFCPRCGSDMRGGS